MGLAVALSLASCATNIAWLDDSLFIADTFNNAIRRLSGPMVTTVAGGRGRGFQDGIGGLARFYHPRGIAAHDRFPSTFYVADEGNAAIRMIDASSGLVTTVLAKFPEPGLLRPTGLYHLRGVLFITDPDHGAVFRIDPQGTPSATVIHRMEEPAGIAGDGGPNLYVTSLRDSSLVNIPLSPSGPRNPSTVMDCNNKKLPFTGRPQDLSFAPGSVAPGHPGVIFATDFDGNAVLRIELGGCPKDAINPEGANVTKLAAGNGLAPGENANLKQPRGIAVTPRTKRSETIFITDAGQMIKAIDMASQRPAIMGPNGPLEAKYPTVDVVVGASGCGWADGDPATARVWFAEDCEWKASNKMNQRGVGGDGDAKGCTLAGCSDDAPAPSGFTVLSAPRTGGQWLMGMLSIHALTYAYDACKNQTVSGRWLRARNDKKPERQECSFDLFKDMATWNWDTAAKKIETFHKTAKRAYPRPYAAGYQVQITEKFVESVDDYAHLSAEYNNLDILIVRKQCLEHFVSIKHDERGGIESIDIEVNEAELKEFCENRNSQYEALLTELPLPMMIAYEDLDQDPLKAVFEIMERLRVPKSMWADEHSLRYAALDPKLHKDSAFQYVKNADEVRKMKPEKWDFRLQMPGPDTKRPSNVTMERRRRMEMENSRKAREYQQQEPPAPRGWGRTIVVLGALGVGAYVWKVRNKQALLPHKMR